jgi:hypothetical protein
MSEGSESSMEDLECSILITWNLSGFAAESFCYKRTAQASVRSQLTVRLGALGLDVIVDEDFICPQ